MSKKSSFFKSKSVGFIIITTCVAIVLVLVVSIVLTTYTSFKNSIREAVNVQTRELSAQIVYNYENYINSIIEISNIIQGDIEQYDLEEEDSSAAFAVFLTEIIHLKSDIIKIGVYEYTTGSCLASSNAEEMGQRLGYDGDDSHWFYEAIADPTVHTFSVPYSEAGSSVYKVNISKQIKLESGGPFAVLKIEISFQNFIELVEKSNLGEGGHITIIDPDYNIVYTSLEQGAAAEEIEVVRGIVLGSHDAAVNGHDMTVNVDTLSNTKWRICVFINIDRLTEIERNFVATTVLVSLSVLLVGVVLFLSAARTITKPMKQLELAMRKVEKSDYFRMEEVDLVASKEVEALTRRFNKMMVKISDLMERVIAEQDAQRKSELKALQNQINPHFLYNTLDSIIWLIEKQKNAEAGEMVVALARLFRIGISKDSEVIPVRDEIEHVRNYLLIQSIRYSDSFDYEFDVKEGTLDLLTMKLVLQPIVENCIYHGLKNKIDHGHIHIRVQKTEDYLELSVADNGYGMRQETIDKLYKSFEDGVVSDSVGLKNIYQRVMIYYGGDAEMRIESELDEGTTITIKEPLKKE
jgi:two-component system sensor histidine kinase YesM